MYLKDLNDAQKALVLDILIHAMSASEDKSRSERERLEQFCDEMKLPMRSAPKLPLDAALKLLTEISNTVTLRKVLVELAMLAMEDLNYDALERAFMNRFAALTGLCRSEFEEIIRLLEEIMHARQQLDELVNSPV